MGDPSEILKEYFGYTSFRPGQMELIEAILSGRDALGIMPTGGGKSLCYQIPALMSHGVSVVISPLISLMKDQVTALRQNGIQAAYLNSTLTSEQYSRALARTAEGLYRIVYIAPERLQSGAIQSVFKRVGLSLVAVDEAHCVSQWGHDFRTDYLNIPAFVDSLPQRPELCAFTATATPRVREDIQRLLQMRNPFIMVTPFDRPNLSFEVRHVQRKDKELLSILSERSDKSGIIYCSTRKTVEKVHELLLSRGINATRYHAGLREDERRSNQDDFIYDRTPVMVATNAFGMGIDKPDVAFVVHYNMPLDLESYYQEAGRAGRDGEKADCILLYSGQDIFTAQFLIENSDDTSGLDSEELERSKQRRRLRLRQIIDYCQTTDCLRAQLLSYFGETPPERCGNCSNCRADLDTRDITVPAQMILSCVYRMRERYGAKTVGDVLRAAPNDNISVHRLDELSTYGLMKEYGEHQLQDIIAFLTRRRFLSRTPDRYALLQLGPRSDEVLHQKIALSMPIRRADKLKNHSPVKTANINPNLYERLRTLRSHLAAQQGVPAYMVFSNATLTDMCQKLPMTADEFRGVSGVGETKTRLYSAAFLGTILQFLKEKENH